MKIVKDHMSVKNWAIFVLNPHFTATITKHKGGNDVCFYCTKVTTHAHVGPNGRDLIVCTCIKECLIYRIICVNHIVPSDLESTLQLNTNIVDSGGS